MGTCHLSPSVVVLCKYYHTALLFNVEVRLLMQRYYKCRVLRYYMQMIVWSVLVLSESVHVVVRLFCPNQYVVSLIEAVL